MSLPKKIYMVVSSYYDTYDIDSFWYRSELAEKRLKEMKREMGSEARHLTIKEWCMEDDNYVGV